MPTADELVHLVGQRTWDKELNLWLGPESKLLPLLNGIQVESIDLLDLFDHGTDGNDDDEIRQHLSRALRQRLKARRRMN